MSGSGNPAMENWRRRSNIARAPPSTDYVDQALRTLAEVAGVTLASIDRGPAPPGIAIHESGTARMGRDPGSSVLAILDRIVHNAYRIELAGESMRKRRMLEPSA